MIILEVNAFFDLVQKATSLAFELQDGWYRGSAEVDAFQDQVFMLSEKQAQWSDQVRRHGLVEDKRLLRAVEAAIESLEKQQQYVRRLEKRCLLRQGRKMFPGQLTTCLDRVLAIVEAGPQLVAGRVATHDLLERTAAQTQAPLPFIPDSNYVPITYSILEIQKEVEDEKGPRVVTVFGGPGLGKSSVVKYIALHYQEEKHKFLNVSPPESFKFPDGVYYLFCGQNAKSKIKELQIHLLESMGFGGCAVTPPNDWTACGLQPGEYFQQPSPEIKLRSRLDKQKLLIVLDDLWEKEVLQKLLVPAKGVRYLVTSQNREIWGVAKKIQLRKPTMSEGRRIMANHTDGLPTPGEFPDRIANVTDTIIEDLEYHPLSLANVGISINRRRATDESHWKAINNNLHVLLDENDLHGSPVVYDVPYNLTVGASMLLMMDSLLPEARPLLFLLALLEGKGFPETLVSFLYKFVQTVGGTNCLLKYATYMKYLEDRSLVEFSTDRSLVTTHDLRMHYIREKKTLDVRSIATQILARNDQVELIKRGDSEETLVAILSAMYYKRPFTNVIASSLEYHLRIIDDGVIPVNIGSGIDAVQMVKGKRGLVEDLLWLLNIDSRDPGWKQQAHGHAKKIIIKLACQGELDDYSMARLIQIPQTTSRACATVSALCLWVSPHIMQSHFDHGRRTFSSTHGETMKVLLALLHDNATSTKRRVAVIRALRFVLGLESYDTILSVAEKWVELLTMDSNPTLQIAIAKVLRPFNVGPTLLLRVLITMGTHSRILEVLMELFVSNKDYRVRVCGGETLSWFCTWKCTGLKIAQIPNAIEKLFLLFLSNETLPELTTIGGHIHGGLLILPEIPSIAGVILGGLLRVPENRMKFLGIKGSLEGVGDLLMKMEEIWRATPTEGDHTKWEERAAIAARILGELGHETQLKDTIASLPGVKESLAFWQVMEMVRPLIDSLKQSCFCPNNATRALTILYSNSLNSKLTSLPALRDMLRKFPCGGGPPSTADFLVAGTYFRVCLTRVLVYIEMGTYETALESLDLACHYVDQIVDQDHQLLLASTPFFRWTRSVRDTRAVLRSARIFLQAVLEDHAGALLGINTRLEKDPCDVTALTQRGVVKRLSRDLQGALDDINEAYELNPILNLKDKYDILKQRGYVKHLMRDEEGARKDAEAAQMLRSENLVVEDTWDFGRLWELQKQPINYLSYAL